MSWLDFVGHALTESIAGLASTSPYAVTVTASATAHTKGSWTQLIALTARDTFGILIRLGPVSAATVDTGIFLDVGVGGAGSEVVVAPDLVAGHIRLYNWALLPVHIPAGSRIALRCQSVTASQTIGVGAILLQGHRLGPRPPCGPITAYGLTAATTRGITPASSGTAHVKGGWTQVVASTSRAHKGLFVLAQGTGAVLATRTHILDVGVGAAGSEQVVIPDLVVSTTTTETLEGPFPSQLIGHANIPSGSRIAVRAQNNSTQANTFEVGVYGLG